MPTLTAARGILYREWFHLKHNVRDFYDSYLSRPIAPVATPLGFKLGGLTSQHHRAMQKGTFEPDEVALLTRLLRDSDLFVDVGANVGYFTCLARRNGVCAIAIEPMAVNLRALYENLRANGWEDTEVLPMGMSDQVGIQTLFGASSTGASLIDNWAGAPSMFHRSISVSTLDTILDGRFEGKRMLIKADVEGHEYHVIRGARRLLARAQKPIWLIEIALNEFHPSSRNPTFRDTFEMFWADGYLSWRLEGGTLRAIGREDIDRWLADGTTGVPWLNYLFAPRDRQPAQLG
jgi:FkbM family methyltransferase